MAAFIYRCPNTGLRMQAVAAAEGITEDEDTSESARGPRRKRASAERPSPGGSFPQSISQISE
jgi:hypothetical protein